MFKVALKVALIGGLLAALIISGFSLGDLLFGLIGLGSALFVLAIVIDLLATFLEWVGRRSDSLHYGHSVRMQRPRSTS